jgi:hypothetical protein
MGTKQDYRQRANLHTDASEHHADVSSHHHALAKEHDKLEQGEIAEHHKALGKLHEKISKGHTDYAAHYMEKCEKAMDSDDLNKLVPDQVRAVIPAAYGSAVTAIPRAGAPPMNNGAAKVDVPLEFEHLVKVE